MVPMNQGIIERRCWGLGSRSEMSQALLILLEQYINHPDHLTRKSANHLLSTDQSAGALINSAFTGDQPLIHRLPLRIPLNGSPHDEIHRLLHLPHSTGGETG